jgi:dolichyl-phosphate-mannose-protein mannosyltransferase
VGRRVTTIAYVAIAVLAATALRAWVLSSSTGGVDADEAVVALMARGALYHHQHPAFFWGQSYGGTLEPALVAGAFKIAGSSLPALKFVPLALCATAAVLVARVARRAIDAPAAPFAGALFLVYPPAFIWWSTKERGFYWVSLLCALAGVLFVLRIAQSSTAPKMLDVVALGAAVGVGWWTSPQTMFVLAPALVWLVVRERRDLRRLVVAVPVAVVTAFPWWAWNLGHDFRSLRQPQAAVSSTYLDRLHLFFARLLPTLLGARRPFTGDWLFGPAIGVTLYLVALGTFIVVAAHAWRRRDAVALLLVSVAIAYPFLFAVPTTSYFVGEPRYGLMLAPVVVLFVALATRRPGAQLAVVVLACLLAISTVNTTVDVADANPYSADLVPPSRARLTRLEHTLERAGINRVYADYWIAYPLTFATRERISATPINGTRSLPLLSTVMAAPRSTYVAFTGRPLDDALRRAFDRLGVRYRRVEADEFSVYYLDRRLDPSRLATSRSDR